MRREVRVIFKLICKVYPASKLFSYLVEGLKSKNAKQRTGIYKLYVIISLVLYKISVTNNSNNSYDNLDLVELNLYSEKVNCVCRPLIKFRLQIILIYTQVLYGIYIIIFPVLYGIRAKSINYMFLRHHPLSLSNYFIFS